MKVRAVIAMNRGIGYEIDGIYYVSSMFIPEIVRDKVIDTHFLINKTMFIITKSK